MRKYLVLLALCVGGNDITACDVCGGQDGYAGQGLLALLQGHLISVQHQYSRYGSTYVPLSEYKPVTYGNISSHSIQVGGRYFINSRWQVSGYLPYKSSTVATDTSNVQVSGIGDATLLVCYTLIKPDKDKPMRHQLMAGAGIKAPTGKANVTNANETTSIIQPGSGAWDMPLNLNYTLMYNKAGISTDISALLTTVTPQGYKYGNRLSANAMGYYMVQKDKTALIPQVGLRYEYAQHDYDNYAKKWLNEQSGGYVLSGRAGVQFMQGKFCAQLFGSLPLSQRLNSGNLQLELKTEAGIIFLF